MNSRIWSWIALVVAALIVAGCFFTWFGVGDEKLYRLAIQTGAFKEQSLFLKKGSIGILAVLGAYLAWSFRLAPLRKYAQLMMLFGLVMLATLATVWPWRDADLAGLKPGIGLLLCGGAGVLYLVSSIAAFFSVRRTVQP